MLHWMVAVGKEQLKCHNMVSGVRSHTCVPAFELSEIKLKPHYTAMDI